MKRIVKIKDDESADVIFDANNVIALKDNLDDTTIVALPGYEIETNMNTAALTKLIFSEDCKPIEIKEIKLEDENDFAKDAEYSKATNLMIASRNYAEGDKRYFTCEEALEIEKKLKDTGWRLPTRHEWVLLAEEFASDENGGLDAKKFAKALKLSYAGLVSGGSLTNVGSWGNYWSSTAYSSDQAYYLYFNSNGVYTLTDYRYLGYSVRLVKDIKPGEVYFCPRGEKVVPGVIE